MRAVDFASRVSRHLVGNVGFLAILWFFSSCSSTDEIGVAGSENGPIGGGESNAVTGTAFGLAGVGGRLVGGFDTITGSGGSTANSGGRVGFAGGAAGSGAMGGTRSDAATGAGNGGAYSDSAGVSGSAGTQGKAGVGGSGAGGASGPLTKLTLWIAGDSTVKTYDPAVEPVLEGWGQEIGQFFVDAISVNNQAIGGRSTRTFMYDTTCVNNVPVADKTTTPAQWGRIKNGIKAGDILLIQFGHNDAGTVCERHVELDEYKENLSVMVDIIVAQGATPILVTPMSKLSYKNGVFQANLTDYADAMKTVAKQKGLECVDLNTRSLEFYQKAGYEEVSQNIFEPGGNTHFQKKGAIEMARLIILELDAINSPLARYIR
jgi:lysophospholipase L1-like esterase